MRLCADVGGSFVDIAAFDERGAIGWRAKRPTPVGDWAAFVALFADALRAVPCARVSIATAGLVDPANGIVTTANIACIHGRTLADDLAAALGIPVRVVNDADAFVLAEATLGVAQGHDRVFGIILGTGVGGGLVEHGRIVGGRGGLGGEWGHGPVVQSSRVAPDAMPVFACGCGRRGCLDTIGSARGIERLHAFLHGHPADSIAITRGAAAGEPRAVATVDYWCDLVGGPLAMLLHALSATIVPVGGGLANAGGLIAALDARVRANLLAPTTTPIVVPGRLGEDAGLIGAFVAGT
ncbi:ROK family protein [Sphingomonas sp. 2R-10]|uniref:ROK family protein n=1 Tax=Sphingomonas sp. 2R-10 TaxID=3045148 RepID=UPI000F77F645|nr:ROK family protein [Sphingomonas sp. 2R-10]MDJ0278687.1 ROK family protein [Sphingomonas sp. 2R-10]